MQENTWKSERVPGEVEVSHRVVQVRSRLLGLARPQERAADHVQRPGLHGLVADTPELLERLAELVDARVLGFAEVLVIADAPEDVAFATLVHRGDDA